MKLSIDLELEESSGRWIADIPALPGVIVYGENQADAIAKVTDLARWRLADMLKHGELNPLELDIPIPKAA